MADDAEITVEFLDGASAPHQQLSGQNPSLAVAPEMLLRSNGAMVGLGNPLPTRTPAAAGAATAALSGSLVLKAAAGILSQLQLWANTAGYFLLIDAAAVPAPGAVTPRRVWAYSGTGTVDVHFEPPLQMANGAVVVFSSTGPFAFTSAGANAFISGEIV